ncbi:MAG: class I SAM-dependent RNA methyltransferase [Bdellovibrionales bacterium]|nr:class I SAM-dependent RNA methyltransferase [Bdellovibrionales bacterium]
MLKLNDHIEVQIEKMANEGKGLARYQKQVVFVPLSAPGDFLKVKIVKINKNFLEAEIVEIIQPSQLRITPPCGYYSQCGGCNFQHIKYEEQLKLKTQLVKETLSKFLKTDELPFKESVASPKPFHYRNRVQLHSENGEFGFYKRQSHQLLPITECLIAEEELNSYLKQLKHDTPNFKNDRIELFLDKTLSANHRYLSEKSNVGLFSQVNRFQNAHLIKAVIDNYNQLKSPVIFDLFAGSGNFTFPLQKTNSAAKIYGVELSSALVKQAKSEITADHSINKNISFIESSVERFLQQYKIGPDDFILLDPPRTGCHPEVMYQLGSSKKNQIVYISCNYITLARDLAVLQQTAQNWKLALNIQKIQCFDMFPQTDHIEVLVSFSVS